MAPNEAFPKARVAELKALELDPNLAEAHTSFGLIQFQYDWNWKNAEQEFHKAIEINPNYAPVHHFYADYLKALGRFDEALIEIEKARELDPLSLVINTGVGHVLYLSRQYDKAIEEYRRAVELDPRFMATHLWFGRPYLEKGMYIEAIAGLETAVQLSGESTPSLAMLGHGLASAGRTARTQTQKTYCLQHGCNLLPWRRGLPDLYDLHVRPQFPGQVYFQLVKYI
jgi:tetratricopeptide (TPR) repeat protein